MKIVILPKLPSYLEPNISRILNPVRYIDDRRIVGIWIKYNELLKNVSPENEIFFVFTMAETLKYAGMSVGIKNGTIKYTHDNVEYIHDCPMITSGDKIIFPNFGFINNCDSLSLHITEEDFEDIDPLFLTDKLRSDIGQITVNIVGILFTDGKYCSNFQCYEVGRILCGRCEKVYYCSEECKKNDWEDHKYRCCK